MVQLSVWNHRPEMYLESDKRSPYSSPQVAANVDIQDILPQTKSHPVAWTFQDLHLSTDRQLTLLRSSNQMGNNIEFEKRQGSIEWPTDLHSCLVENRQQDENRINRSGHVQASICNQKNSPWTFLTLHWIISWLKIPRKLIYLIIKINSGIYLEKCNLPGTKNHMIA